MAGSGYTVVTCGPILDVNGNVYSSAKVEASLDQSAIGSGTGPALIGGTSVFQTIVNGETDSFGNLTLTLADVNQITPSGCVWDFSVVSSGGLVGFTLQNQVITGATQNIATAMRAASAPLGNQFTPGTVPGNLTINGNLGVNGSTTTQSLNGTFFADQFAGADMGAKINAAIAAMPAIGGILNATAFNGTQSAAATINISKRVLLQLGSVTLQLAGSPGINLSANGAAIEGISPVTTVVQANTGTNDVIQTNASNNTVRNLSINSAVARTAGAGIRCKGGVGLFENFTIDKTWNGIQISDASGSATGLTSFRKFTMGQLGGPAGTQNVAIQIGPVASGTISGIFFDDGVMEATGSGWATAMIVLDSGCDTIHFTNVQGVANVGGVDTPCLFMQNTSTAQDPTYTSFTNCAFESGTTATGVTITAGALTAFVNCGISSCKTSFNVQGGKALRVAECEVGLDQQNAFVVSGGTDLQIVNCRIWDTSTSSNGGFNSIDIAAAVTDFHIVGNDFTTIASSANQPFNNIKVAAGASDRYWILNNRFTNNTGGGLTDGGTGTDKLVAFNSPGAGVINAIVPAVNNSITLLNAQGVTAPITGTGADATIYTYTLPAKTMQAGKGIRVTTAFIHGTGSASVAYKLSFGATAVLNPPAATAGSYFMTAVIMNDPASTSAQRGSGLTTSAAAVIQSVAGNALGENTTAAIVVKLTFNVAATDQVTGGQWLVELIQ